MVSFRQVSFILSRLEDIAERDPAAAATIAVAPPVGGAVVTAEFIDSNRDALEAAAEEGPDELAETTVRLVAEELGEEQVKDVARTIADGLREEFA